MNAFHVVVYRAQRENQKRPFDDSCGVHHGGVAVIGNTRGFNIRLLELRVAARTAGAAGHCGNDRRAEKQWCGGINRRVKITFRSSLTKI